MLNIFPLASEAIRMAPAAVPKKRMDFSAQEICELARQCYSTDPTILDAITGEWLEYQLDCVEGEQSVVQFWSCARTEELFPNISKLMRIILTLPHSNASSERIFSMLKKIKTEQRSLLRF